MRTNELRIGNKVKYKNEIVEIISTNGVVYSFGKIDIGIKTINGFRTVDLKNLNPIPLTEEWLVKLGANKIHDVLDIFELDRFELYPFYTHGFWKVVDKETKTYITKVSHVHELQNMYFALNGEELQL